MHRRPGSIPILPFAVFAVLAGFAPALAQQQPNPREGERLARQWCASCHLVARDQAGPVPNSAPAFGSIAARPQATQGALRASIQMPYARMPQIALSRDEIEHIIAYILSLRAR